MTDTKMSFTDALIAHFQGAVVEVRALSTKEEPWEGFSSYHRNCRLSDMESDGFAGACEFRIKPRTVICNGVEVPAPESVAPADGELFYTPAPLMQGYANEDRWSNMPFDTRALERGVVYLREEDAIARAKAMLITK